MRGELTREERDAPYRCAFCGRWYVVTSLAKDCAVRDARLAGLCTPPATIASSEEGNHE